MAFGGYVGGGVVEDGAVQGAGGVGGGDAGYHGIAYVEGCAAHVDERLHRREDVYKRQGAGAGGCGLRYNRLRTTANEGRMGMAFLLGCEKVRVEFPTKTVFEGVSLGVDEGDRIGIVGRNGDGKSTLLALLAGALEPDDGRVLRNGTVRVGMLGQTDALDPEATVGEAIVGDLPEYEWAGDARIRDIIAGLARDIPWDARVGTLSGGQRRRVDLVRLLIGDWDVLALDEPTNHLDVRAITWLAGHLKNRWRAGQGALLVVTHDRWFLDEVCLRMWEVHDRTVEPFEGCLLYTSAALPANTQPDYRRHCAW